MRASEWIQVGFVTVLAAAAWTRPLPLQRRLRVTTLAVVVVGAITATWFAPRFLPPLHASMAHDWLPAALLLVPYWQIGQFFTRPDQRIQDKLAAFDRCLFKRLIVLRPTETSFAGSFLLELAYFMSYPLVPLGLGVLYVAGMRGRADEYWVVTLLSTYFCYAVTPFVRALPPRALAGDQGHGNSRSSFRVLNEWVLDQASIQAITFPSAHVAATIAASLVLVQLVPWVGLLFVALSGGIAVAAIAGRYHYVLDVLLGAVVAAAAFLVHLRFMR